MAKIIIARHGQSEHNVAKLISGGGSNPALSPEGVTQAHKLGEVLLAEYSNKFSFMVTSSMLRTNKTGEIANEYLNIEQVYYDRELREKEYGNLEGRANNALTLQKLGFDDAAPGGESNAVFVPRVINAVCKYLKSAEPLIFIVAHGYVIEMITEKLLDNPQYKQNCEFVVIEPADIIDFAGKCKTEIENNYYADRYL